AAAQTDSANIAGTYAIHFTPRSEPWTLPLIIAVRPGGYRATIPAGRLAHAVSSDSVMVQDGRVHVYMPNDIADFTFDCGVQASPTDWFLLHFDDGDMRGLLVVDRPKR